MCTLIINFRKLTLSINIAVFYVIGSESSKRFTLLDCFKIFSRLRRQNRKTRRYGVLDTNIENMELTPLEQDDDDDDTTLFDASHPRRFVFRT